MPWAAIIPALISSAAGLGGTIYANKKNEKYADKAWEKQTEYNDPKNQMARYRNAGLNPNLIYGSAANTAQTYPKVEAKNPGEHFKHLADIPKNLQIKTQKQALALQMENQSLQNDLLEAQIEDLKNRPKLENEQLKQETDKLAAQTSNTQQSTINLQQQKELISHEISNISKNNRLLDVKLSYSEKIAATNLAKLLQEVENLRITKDLSLAQIEEAFARTAKTNQDREFQKSLQGLQRSLLNNDFLVRGAELQILRTKERMNRLQLKGVEIEAKTWLKKAESALQQYEHQRWRSKHGKTFDIINTTLDVFDAAVKLKGLNISSYDADTRRINSDYYGADVYNRQNYYNNKSKK